MSPIGYEKEHILKVVLLFIITAIFSFANIATVVDAVGTSHLLRDGKSIIVVQKQQLKEHDTIKTGDNAKVKIFFKDNTVVSLGQNTSFNINTYYFTGKKDSNIKFKVLKGFFKTVTGEISKVAPQRFKLQTKNATIGIRGTVFAADVGAKADVVICTDGTIILFTPKGDVEVPQGGLAKTTSSAIPQVKNYSEQEKQDLINSAGWHGSMSLRELIAYIRANFQEPLRGQLLATIQNILDKDSSEREKYQTKSINADNESFVDAITINGREFDELPNDIIFFKEDLQSGKIIVKGILESDDKNTPLQELHVEITTDGGSTWSRAEGQGEWEWSFFPKLEKNYAFSLRVVKDEKVGDGYKITGMQVGGNKENNTTSGGSIGVSRTLQIAGFTLELNADANFVSGKLSGSGKITIPYLAQISNFTTNTINVNFNDLSISGNMVTMGDIVYEREITIPTPIVDLNIHKIVFSPTLVNNKIEADVEFKNELASFGTIPLPTSSKILPTSFSLTIPFSSKTINIWQEKGVELDISSGSLGVSYRAGDSLPRAQLNIPSAQFKLGELLKYTDGSAVEMAIADFGRMPSMSIPRATKLLDTGIVLPSGLEISLNLSDYADPKLSFSSSVNLSGFENIIARNLDGATIEAHASKSGFSATISASNPLNPITIIDRGSDENDVKLVFKGDNPSFTIGITNSDLTPSFSLSGVNPEIHFGDLFKNATTGARELVASLGSLSAPHINIPNSLFLLGSKIKLPSGIDALVDLADIANPKITFNTTVDFSQYDNFVAKHISGAIINATISRAGFIANVTSAKPTPIMIYEPKDVKLKFLGDNGPSFSIKVTGVGALPKFDISDINAQLDFGSLLKDATADGANVLADVGVLREEGLEYLNLTLPSRVKLLESKFAFEGINANLNLQNKEIKIESTADLSAYADNPVLRALDGAQFDATLNPSEFRGSLKVEDELEPISIWSSKRVSLKINGLPSISVVVNGSGLSFDLGALNASIDFGDLLKNASGTSMQALINSVANSAGDYTVTLRSKAYLLGSTFALAGTRVGFNLNKKSLTFSAIADLSAYSNPVIKAFDGASLSAKVSTAGFSGTLTKEGGFSPIIILNRGGSGKDVSLEFTSSPIVGFSILSSGMHFDFSGGSAKLHFGDLLNNATALLSSVEDGVYSWGLGERTQLFHSARAYLSNINNGKLDIKDITNPKISFDATVDLSGYGGILASVNSATLENAVISRAGFKADLSVSLGNINIWREKRVSLDFKSNPTIQLAIGSGGLNISFSNIHADLNFGDLLNDAKATIRDALAEGSSSLGGESRAYTWSVEGVNRPLFGSRVLLSSIGGSLDLSDFSNPSIILNASADLSGYSQVFRYIRRADLQNVKISKEGFSGSLLTDLQEIPIWKEKGVKVVFDETAPPTFYLSIKSSGLKVGIKNLHANVKLGSLLNDSVASLISMGEDTYSWSLEGRNKLGDTSVFLSTLIGALNLANLKNPIINLNATVDIDSLGSAFRGVSLENGKISKEGFEGDLSANLTDILLYHKDTKKVELKFDEGRTPTLHLSLTREHFGIGLSDLSAKIVFTNLLNNQALSLTPHLVSGQKKKSMYDWSLAGTYNFLNDTNGVVPVSDISGSINLSDWTNPIVTFHTRADFTNYHLADFLSLGVVEITRAQIQKTKIKWNVEVTNASIDFKILELGSGENDDVRVELRNISGSASSSGASVSGADGTLFFGKLFSGNKQIGLTYHTSDTGLKSYGFSFSEDIIYKKDDNNFITFRGLSGDVIEVSEGHYKVVLRGRAIARSDALNAISIDELSLSNLEIGSDGFKGDLTASWDNLDINILEDKATLDLRSIGVHIDSSASMPIKLTAFDGDLDLHQIFDGRAVKAGLSYASSAISWSFGSGRVLSINDNFTFKNLNGVINLSSLDALSIGLSGTFGYKDINKDITLSDFLISAQGVEGTASFNGSIRIFDKLNLTKLSVTFAGAETSGNVGLSYINPSFLSTGKPLNLALRADVDRRGISSFAIDTTGASLSSIDVPNFAKFTFTNVEASPNLNDFWISLDGTIKPQNVLFNANVSLAFEDLKISSSGVSIGSAGATVDTAGASAKLGGLGLSINTVGLGFQSGLFYISANGDIDLSIVSAGATLKLFSDKSLAVDDIAISINQSGLVAGGTLSWYKDDTVYGNGFKATIGLNIASMVSMSGLFRIGQKGDTFYWMALASGSIGSGIPFGALTFYELGGGIAYNMSFNETNHNFVPHNGALGLILTTNLGTSGDSGFMWNGDIRVLAQITDGNLDTIRMDGHSWLLSNRGSKPAKRNINASIVYATSPKALHITVDANIEYHKIKVMGSMDALFSSSEKHIFVGTDSDYAYQFNITRSLGHVQVGIFGINATGFFMVDTRAIAFGAGININKHWSKSWWGPDPSLDFKLIAGTKALIVYRPTFQMNLDVGVEVGLKACYGGCISLGADVLLKLATPSPNYLWAKARIHIFGKGITFKRYIYGSGDLQTASEAPTPKIFDHVEPISSVTGLLPFFKVYSAFSKAQSVNVKFISAVLKDTTARRTIPLDKVVLAADEDKRGISYILHHILAKNHRYVLSGVIRATYGLETKTQTYTKVFMTRNDNRVDFTQIVDRVTPTNNQQNVKENDGVKIIYNRRTLYALGQNSTYANQYKIELFDADGNKISGTFTRPDSNMVSRFKPNKILRVYLYSKNENGRIRETFTDSEGHFLNPFNGYTVDKGNGSGSETAPTITVSRRDFETSIVRTVVRHIGEIPAYIRRGNIRFRNPEALGELIVITRNDGKYYSYYRANSYKISVKYIPTGQNVYNSIFKVRYNNISAEAKRKVEQMNTVLDPSLTVSLDTDRVGAMGVHARISTPFGGNYNKGFYNEVRMVIDDGLNAIGVFIGVKTKVIATFKIQTKNGSIQTIQRELNSNKIILPGIVEHYSAKIQYISKESGELILEKPMRLIAGEPFSAVAEEVQARRDRQNEQARQERLKNIAKNAKRYGAPHQATGVFGAGGASGTTGGRHGSGSYGSGSYGAGNQGVGTHVIIGVGGGKI